MRKPASVAALETLGRVRLSEHFFMRDFLYSEIANFHGMPNIPDFPDVAIEAGSQLCAVLLEPLRARLAAGMPAYGSCAGMILLASEILDAGAPGREAASLGAIDMTVRRNAFGRQVDSFEADLEFRGLDGPAHAVFIRAPWVERVGAGVEVLARAGEHVVAVRQGSALATAFHPEVTGDRRVHKLFVDMVAGRA